MGDLPQYCGQDQGIVVDGKGLMVVASGGVAAHLLTPIHSRYQKPWAPCHRRSLGGLAASVASSKSSIPSKTAWRGSGHRALAPGTHTCTTASLRPAQNRGARPAC